MLLLVLSRRLVGAPASSEFGTGSAPGSSENGTEGALASSENGTEGALASSECRTEDASIGSECGREDAPANSPCAYKGAVLATRGREPWTTQDVELRMMNYIQPITDVQTASFQCSPHDSLNSRTSAYRIDGDWIFCSLNRGFTKAKLN